MTQLGEATHQPSYVVEILEACRDLTHVLGDIPQGRSDGYWPNLESVSPAWIVLGPNAGVQSKSMNPGRPPSFDSIADAQVKRAFVGRAPECVIWLEPRTKLYKWSDRITGKNGISPWWLFLDARLLPTGVRCDGFKEKQEYAQRLTVHDRDYHRVRAGVTKQWNLMRSLIAIRLDNGAWGYVGKAAAQLMDDSMPDVYFIAGDYQVWVPGLKPGDITQISVLREMDRSAPQLPWLAYWEFCRELGCLDRDPGAMGADRISAEWLQQFKQNPSKMAAMRSLLLDEHSAWQISSLSDDQVIEQVTGLISSAQLHIHAQPEDVVASTGATPEPPVVPFPLSQRRRPEPEADPAPVKDPPTFSDIDGSAQAAALTAAAADGKPFCPE